MPRVWKGNLIVIVVFISIVSHVWLLTDHYKASDGKPPKNTQQWTAFQVWKVWKGEYIYYQMCKYIIFYHHIYYFIISDLCPFWGTQETCCRCSQFYRKYSHLWPMPKGYFLLWYIISVHKTHLLSKLNYF